MPLGGTTLADDQPARVFPTIVQFFRQISLDGLAVHCQVSSIIV